MHRHEEQRFLPYAPDRMFDLVADIERYPEFLPWCRGARILERSDRLVLADLIIGFRVFRETFTSRVRLDRPNMRIDVDYERGPLKQLTNRWLFLPADSAGAPLPETGGALAPGCIVDFLVDFSFRSRLLEAAMHVLFGEAVTRMVGAFETRAADIYGHAAVVPGPAGDR
ncbi:MAG: type II toxin-antitoxin system RatA family toxin [Alphaproteobacteria bacterium]